MLNSIIKISDYANTPFSEYFALTSTIRLPFLDQTYKPLLLLGLKTSSMKYLTKTILCVDDDVDDFDMLEEALNGIEEGLEIISALDGVHALELLQQMKLKGHLPCLIVLDINMPRMDGKQTITAIQRDSTLNTIPIVLFSTSSSEIDKIFSLSKHVELITKPLTVKTLQTIASKLLRYCDGHLIAEALCSDVEPFLKNQQI